MMMLDGLTCCVVVITLIFVLSGSRSDRWNMSIKMINTLIVVGQNILVFVLLNQKVVYKLRLIWKTNIEINNHHLTSFNNMYWNVLISLILNNGL